SIAVRLQQLFSWMRDEVVAADLRQVSVLASESQAAFCRQLGLNVISTFSDAKSASENPGEIDRAADIGSQAEIRFIITNRHGERQVAEALADRTGGQVIEFAAVPETNDANAFDKMVRGNVRLLLDASTGSRGGRVP
ncbi:MAG: metal ABC transporter solute-binding protein, Zn/Mn family, partial [Planctomycetota bacterium]